MNPLRLMIGLSFGRVSAFDVIYIYSRPTRKFSICQVRQFNACAGHKTPLCNILSTHWCIFVMLYNKGIRYLVSYYPRFARNVCLSIRWYARFTSRTDILTLMKSGMHVMPSEAALNS